MIKSGGRRPDGIHISLNIPLIARVFDITGGVRQPSPPLGSARRGGDGEIWPAAWCVGRGSCTPRAESLRLSSHPERICRGVTQRGLDDRHRPGQVSTQKNEEIQSMWSGPLYLFSFKPDQCIIQTSIFFFNRQQS